MQPQCLSILNSINNNYTHTKAIADTGSTGHYINDHTPQSHLQQGHHILPSVTLPDNTSITASHAAILPLSNQLSHEATTAFSFPNIARPLVSIGKICDDDCVAIFSKEKCYIIKDKHINIHKYIPHSFLTGDKNFTTKLWDFDLSKNFDHQSNASIYEMKLKDLRQSHHKALCSPTKYTWLQAISKGLFST